MAKTQVPSGYIEDNAITTAKIADNTIQAAHLHSSHGITTNNIGEHANNKYYTDARVDTRLAATKSANFVTTGNILVNSDSNYIKLGSGDDLFIKHNGTDSYIENYTGHLYIKNFADDKDIHFQSDDGSGGTTSYMYLDGSETSIRFAQNLRIDDGVRARFGASNDLQIYHSGTDSFIDESGTGKLFIRGSEIRLNKYSGEFMVRAIADGAVTLYHDNSAKIATTSSGVSVTGTVDATGQVTQTIAGSNYFRSIASSSGNAGLYMQNTSRNWYILNNAAGSLELYDGTASAVRMTINTSGDATFSNNVIVTGNLTVNGSQTVLNTATLDVEDKNITLNKGSGDTSSTADGAGITIQDAVDASNDATLLWNAAGDKFVTSHALDVTGALTSTTINTGQGATEVYLMNQNVRTSDNANFASYQVGGTTVIASDRTMINIPQIGITQTASNSYGFIEMLGTSGAYIDLKNSSSDDYDMRLISFGTGGEIVSGSGDIVIKRQGSTKLSTSAVGITVTGSLTSDTISSGAITSSGALSVNSGSANVAATFQSTDAIAGIKLQDSAGNVELSASGSTFQVQPSGGAAQLTVDASGNATFAGDVTIDDKLTIGDATANSNSFIEFGERMAATESNIPFIGQTNSGNGVSQDLGLGANSSSGTVKIYAGNVTKFNESAVRLKVANTYINFTEPLQMGGTEFLSDARNLSNIGTISSGAITASATSTIQGNLLLDVDNAEINLKSGVGTTSGAVNWTFNSTGTDYASIKLPYATRASKGLWIDSGYPITIDATTRIDFDITGSTRMDLDNSGLGVTGTVVASGNVQHTGLTMTSGTDIDQLYTATDSLTLSDAWQDTSIAGSDLASGTYIVQVYVNDYSVGGGHYQEFYSGTMSWTSAGTNSNQTDEIILHRAGHAPNAGDIYLRTERRYQSGDSGTLMLQIRGSTTNSGASNYIFKFRRMI